MTTTPTRIHGYCTDHYQYSRASRFFRIRLRLSPQKAHTASPLLGIASDRSKVVESILYDLSQVYIRQKRIICNTYCGLSSLHDLSLRTSCSRVIVESAGNQLPELLHDLFLSLSSPRRSHRHVSSAVDGWVPSAWVGVND